MSPAAVTLAGTKCGGSFASLVNAQPAISIVSSNTPVKTFKTRFITEFFLLDE
jgi:hypothetical protein